MKKQLPLSLSVVLLFVGSLVGAMPMRANAGSTVIQGTSDDSSSFSGDTFNQRTVPAPGTYVLVEVNGKIRIPLEVQQGVNQVASKIVKESECGNLIEILDCREPTSTIIFILVRGSTTSAALNKLETSLSNSGVSQALIVVLVNNLAGLFKGFGIAATPGVPVAELQPLQLIASTRVAGSLLAQIGEKSDVDINQLNAAVNAYNDIVLKSDTETLKRLSKNPEFMEINRILKELRVAINAR